jgi:hypothetical protein
LLRCGVKGATEVELLLLGEPAYTPADFFGFGEAGANVTACQHQTDKF